MKIYDTSICIMRMFILSIAIILVLTAIPQSSCADGKIADAKRLDKRAESVLEKAQLLQSLDALDEDESDKICDFAIQYEEAEWIKTRVYKTPFHDDIALTLQNIASLYQFCHAPMAQKYLQSVLSIKEKLYTKESEEAASAHDALANFNRFYMMEFKKAITHYKEAKRIRVKLYGKKDSRITKNYNSLAITLYYHKGEKSMAEQLILEAISTKETSPVNGIFPVYKAYMDAGIYYSMRSSYESAILYFEKALQKGDLIQDSDEITILSELGMIYMNKDNLKTSFKYSKNAYEKAKNLYKKSPTPNFLQHIEQLLDIYNMLGDKKSANRLKVEHKETREQLLKGKS